MFVTVVAIYDHLKLAEPCHHMTQLPASLTKVYYVLVTVEYIQRSSIGHAMPISAV